MGPSKHISAVEVPLLPGDLPTVRSVPLCGRLHLSTLSTHLITEDLDEPLMQQWIVEHEGRAFAYVQAYPANAWPQTHLTHLPNEAVVIDAFIGEPAMLGCGHGSAFLHAVGEK